MLMESIYVLIFCEPVVALLVAELGDLAANRREQLAIVCTFGGVTLLSPFSSRLY